METGQSPSIAGRVASVIAARKLLFSALALLFVLAALAAYFVWFHIRIVEAPAPPRMEKSAHYPVEESVLVTEIGVPLSAMKRSLERDIPRSLYRINEQIEECIPRENITILGRDIGRTPKVSCQLVGEIKRGAITLSGRGSDLRVSFPVSAEIQARDVGGIIKRETATASARINLNARIAIDRDWGLKPDIRISYQWSKEPGIDVLGQRIRFTRRANAELAPILARAEKTLERELSSLNLQSQVAPLWAQGFTTLSLNDSNPPVWMRITPAGIGTGNIRVSGRRLATDVMLRAKLGVFVGHRPPEPNAKPLQANIGVARSAGFEVMVPVLADYEQVEPVILRALNRLAERGISKQELGRLEVAFDDVTLYAAEGGRLAVGIEAQVEPVGNITDRIWGRSKGTIWLTGMPVTKPNSQEVRIENLQVYGDMDTSVGDFLVRVMASEDVKREIESALVEDFSNDYNSVIEKARAGIRSVEAGNFRLSFDITELAHGKVTPTAEGLFMPVTASGTASTALNRRR